MCTYVTEEYFYMHCTCIFSTLLLQLCLGNLVSFISLCLHDHDAQHGGTFVM